MLVGAGKVGQEFLGALTESHIPVMAFTDNNPARWRQTVAEVPVLPPEDAVRQFGRQAVFLITIGRVGTGAADICRQFSELGVEAVLHFSDAIRFIPRIWPQFFVSPDAFVESDAERMLKAYGLFHDVQSKHHFITHLQWRTTLDPAGLATPDYDHQYFPADVISPRHCAVFVDIGAYTGDTLLDLTAFAGSSLREYYGFEPDPANYARLVSQAETTTRARLDVHVATRMTAIGAIEGVISFAGSGSATSQVQAEGSVRVPCTTLDAVGVSRPTYLKIDVEGGEHDVLRGGTETLRMWQPTVAVATYHRPKDLFDLPLWLADNAPDYRFHLRSHGDAGIDLVCYAVREPFE